jgi:hypothetical protein
MTRINILPTCFIEMKNMDCICGLVDVLEESGKLEIEYEKWKTWFIEVRRERRVRGGEKLVSSS